MGTKAPKRLTIKMFQFIHEGRCCWPQWPGTWQQGCSSRCIQWTFVLLKFDSSKYAAINIL